MNLPGKPTARQIIDGSWAASVVAYLRAITLRSGTDYSVSQFANGTTIRPRAVPAPVAAGTAAVIPPLTVQAASEGTVIVTWGTVTAASGEVLTPTIGGDALDLLPAPELVIGGNGRVYLKVTTNVLGVATLAEVVYSGTTLSNSATIGYVLLAQISGYAAGPPVAFAIAVNTSGSQAHQRCGATTHLFGRL